MSNPVVENSIAFEDIMPDRRYRIIREDGQEYEGMCVQYYFKNPKRNIIEDTAVLLITKGEYHFGLWHNYEGDYTHLMKQHNATIIPL